MLPPDLPPISNRALYAYRVLVKWFSFFIFGISSVILAIVVLPLMRLVLHPKARFQKYGRRIISYALRFFVFIMHILGAVNLEVDNRENYRNLSSKIVVANHPSLLDVVMLLALIPNADCIVNAHLNQNILKGVVRQLYILNSLKFEDILNTCTESLNRGSCLIIFPEGTRTPRTGKIILRKGAARISLASNCNIVPVRIGGTDKFGLGKKDPWTGFNPQDRYVYHISMGTEIAPEKYRHLPPPAAARALTNEIAAFIFPPRHLA
jgi:1-acyl-sn-glycerol-3-phosphate acyltransferase